MSSAAFLHAEHIGSLLRPATLRRAFRDSEAGRIDTGTFLAIQDECVRTAVAKQEDIGLGAVTDGEFRRQSYWSHFVRAVKGFDVSEARFDFRNDAGDKTHFLSPHVSGKIAWVRSISVGEYEFLKTVTRVIPKLTMPSPPTMDFWAQPGALLASGYADRDEYFRDLAQVYVQELRELATAGVTYVQLDEVPLAMLCDTELRAQLEGAGEAPDRVVQSYVNLINACVTGRPRTLRVGLHLCRGNFKGRYLSDGGYDYVARKVFNEVDVDTFLLEYDTERAGGFEPLAAVPPHRCVVLGLVSTKVPTLERPDSLKRRIDEASRYLPLERLALSPQCGFASTVGGNSLTEEDQWRKLELIVNTAADVWS